VNEVVNLPSIRALPEWYPFIKYKPLHWAVLFFSHRLQLGSANTPRRRRRYIQFITIHKLVIGQNQALNERKARMPEKMQGRDEK